MNPSKAYPFSKLIKALPLIIVFIGILARLNVYIYNRSFFIDEANLARNVVEKSIPDYFDSLDYEQYAPPLFLMETKIVTTILGTRDYCFRIIPLLCGIGCLILMWMLLKEWDEGIIGRIYALALFSFSVLAIRYGTEFKQYSSDTFLALLLVWLAWKDRGVRWEWSQVAFWSSLGAVCIWYSMPVVFILAGVGLFFLYLHRNKYLVRWMLVVCSWLVSFGAYYYCLLSKDVFDSNLQNHHSDYFLKLLSFNLDDWKANSKLLVLLFKNLTDKTTVPVVFGILTFIVGVYAYYKKSKGRLILLIVPFILIAFASSLHMYSFIPRMTLFLLPLLLMVMARGLAYIWSFSPAFPKFLLAALVSLSIINKDGYLYLLKPMEIENIKTALGVLKDEINPDDPIYVHHEAVPAFSYYNDLSDRSYGFNNVYHGNWQTPIHNYMSSQDSVCWLLYCHTPQDVILRSLNSIDTLGTWKVYYERQNASVYRFESS